MTNKQTLYYVYDPMCSWCWGFKPVWQKIQQAIADSYNVVYVVGGLAADSDEVMPVAMQQQIAGYWKKIETLLGTEFNYDFWSSNSPRRSTYPACRAILSARSQGAEQAMKNAIQRAYYLQARNPSDDDVLLAIAEEIGLDGDQFAADFFAESTQASLLDEIAFARSIGGNSFPSLFLRTEQKTVELSIDYQDADTVLRQLKAYAS